MAGQNRRPDLPRRSDISDRPYDRREERERPYEDRSPVRRQSSPQNAYSRRNSNSRQDQGPDYRQDRRESRKYSRDRSPDQSPDRSRDRDRGRDRDMPPNAPQGPPSKSRPWPTPTKPGKIPGRGLETQRTTKPGPRGTTKNAVINPLTKLVCERVSWMQKKEEAEKRLAKLRDDHARSGIRHMDFPSVTVMFQAQTKSATSDVAMCNDSIKKVDDQLQSQFGQLSTNQLLSNLAGQAHAQSDPTKGEPTKSQPPDPEKRPKNPGTSTSESLTLQLDQKLNEFKQKFDNDLQDLKGQFEATREERESLKLENTYLKKSQVETARKIEELQDKCKSLEQKSVANLTAAKIQLTAMNEQVNKEFANLTTKYQPKSQPQPEPKLPPKPEPGISDAQFTSVVRSQNDKIATLNVKLNSALSSISKFDEQLPSQVKELRESSLQMEKKIPDVSQLNSSVSDHGRRILDQKTMLDTTMAHLASLQSLVSDIPLDKLRLLLEDVPAIWKRLKEDDARTKPDIMTKERVYDMLKCELATAVQKLTDPNPMTEERVREVLRPELANAVDQLLKNNARSEANAMTEEKVREVLKPELANVVDQLLKNTASSESNAVTEAKVRAMLKPELANAAEMLLKDTAKSNSSAMTEDGVREISKQELTVSAKRLQETLSARLEVMATHFGGLIDQERFARVKVNEKIGNLSDRVLSLEKGADGVNSPTDSASSFRRACQMANAAQDKWNDHTAAQIYQQSKEVEGHRNTLSTLTAQTEELRDELRKGHEGHQMQIMHLSAWVNAFNTRRMYNDIVAHINATTPTGLNLTNQMRALSSRLDTLENKEDREDETGVKKRKAPNGNAMLIHNNN
ncbi:hypothetical protein B0J13DRAFT_214077 [Dactylonectria estremocensis]|uniref:Uncharacterized protein n=1 Tax=Dactylonectria estremocensis TaxID=1079267 RepID=A0A9P9F7S3_9HYPO|nr:hypothetical protein B0J13DRAFT_214077 [Dactylonectria estremocensis]